VNRTGLDVSIIDRESRSIPALRAVVLRRFLVRERTLKWQRNNPENSADQWKKVSLLRGEPGPNLKSPSVNANHYVAVLNTQKSIDGSWHPSGMDFPAER
jgi:hypothetical protein